MPPVWCANQDVDNLRDLPTLPDTMNERFGIKTHIQPFFSRSENKIPSKADSDKSLRRVVDVLHREFGSSSVIAVLLPLSAGLIPGHRASMHLSARCSALLLSPSAVTMQTVAMAKRTRHLR